MNKMDTLIKNLNKQAKEEIITVGLNAFSYKRIPFTSPRMNYCTFGGLPVGKLIEFYGKLDVPYVKNGIIGIAIYF